VNENNHGFDPIPLSGMSPPRLPEMGLLPPLPKPATPVEPRSSLPRTEVPIVKNEVVVESPKPPVPGRWAWVPEAMKAMMKPTKQKGVIAAGLASLVCGAVVADWMWPRAKPQPEVEVAKAEPEQTPPVVTPPVTPPPANPAVVIPTAPPVELPKLELPPLEKPRIDVKVTPAGGVALPDLPAIPEAKKPDPVVTLPTTTPKVEVPKAEPGGVVVPPIELPPLKPSTAPLPKVEMPPPVVLPEVDPKAALAPPLAGSSKPAAPTMPPVTVPPPALDIKPTPPPPVIDVKIPPPVVESKPPVNETKPIALPPATTDSFVPSGGKPKVEPVVLPSEPRPLPSTKPAPRQDYDVDVHYPTSGDTWISISKQQLGDERYAEALKAYNANRTLVANQGVDVPPIHVLRSQYAQYIAPSRTVQPASSEVPKPVGGLRTYEIPAGGLTLKEISKKALADENLWGQIWELNPKLRADEAVPAGTRVKLPSDSRIGD
jgi:hypothetical protein